VLRNMTVSEAWRIRLRSLRPAGVTEAVLLTPWGEAVRVPFERKGSTPRTLSLQQWWIDTRDKRAFSGPFFSFSRIADWCRSREA
jgi:hypothetical protein